MVKRPVFRGMGAPSCAIIQRTSRRRQSRWALRPLISARCVSVSSRPSNPPSVAASVSSPACGKSEPNITFEVGVSRSSGPKANSFAASAVSKWSRRSSARTPSGTQAANSERAVKRAMRKARNGTAPPACAKTKRAARQRAKVPVEQACDGSGRLKRKLQRRCRNVRQRIGVGRRHWVEKHDRAPAIELFENAGHSI
jgi:hypothetical protein